MNQRDANAGLEPLEDECAGADGLRPILEAVRDHRQAVVGENVGKIGVGVIERDLDLMRVELLDLRHHPQRVGAALRVFSAADEELWFDMFKHGRLPGSAL